MYTSVYYTMKRHSVELDIQYLSEICIDGSSETSNGNKQLQCES